MDYYTKSKNPYWERDVYLKVDKQNRITEDIKSSSYCRFVLILNGKATLRYHNTTFDLESPLLLLLSEKDTIITLSEYNIECLTLFFLPIALNDYLTQTLLQEQELFGKIPPTVYQDAILLDFFYGISKEKTWRIPILPGSKQVIVNLCSKINRELEEQDSDYWPCRSRSYFIELLFFLNSLETKGFEHSDLVRKEKEIYYEVEKIICYLKENITEKISLELLCKKFGRNRNQMNQIFTSVTGLTAISYLSKLRTEFSEYLLKNTELPINEIAIRSGYTDLGYFCRLFKSLHQMTPIQYRKKMHYM